MTLTATDIATPLAAYARRLHAVAGTGHQVLSPLGAWLLLALLGPASTEETRPSLNAALGCDVADAAELAAGLRDHYLREDDGRLRQYSATRLPATWQAQEFSHWMLQLLHTPEIPDPAARAFMHRLQMSRLDQLRRSPSYAEAFARSYVGTD